ncbi:hypothetical protein AB0I51_37080 [Streptomyces sp. NPDC050549]|uniref:cupin domain-containing protein n=1 Tax=Streptomyces sp. NPDC050549 TaxID=3155406 RepID=UPI003447E5C5
MDAHSGIPYHESKQRIEERLPQATGDWRSWESANGAKAMRGGPGSFMFVPAECPHAFSNPGAEPARMLFLVSPAGHATCLQELTDLLSASEPPDQAEIAALRLRHDIHQLTPLTSPAQAEAARRTRRQRG